MNEIPNTIDRITRVPIISLKYTNIYLHIKILSFSHVGIKCSLTEDKKTENIFLAPMQILSTSTV